MVSSTSSRGWSRGAITRASALPVFGLMKPAIRQALSGWASHCSRKPTTSGDLTAGGGGCEDPRITFVEPLPALRDDLHGAFAHRPTDRPGGIGGFVSLEASGAGDLRTVSRQSISSTWTTKDASLFPVAIPNHAGKMQLALLHRPLFPETRPEETACKAESAGSGPRS